MDQYTKTYFEEFKQALDQTDSRDITAIMNVLLGAHKSDKHIFVMGNGGSASISSHFACDLGKGTLQRVYDLSEKRFRVVSLTDNVAQITAFANDLSYDDIFRQQLHNLITAGDVVIGITGSGNSQNIVKAFELAKKMQATTVGFLGFDGGVVKDLCDFKVIVPSRDYGIIESVHTVIAHLIPKYIAMTFKNNLSS